MFREGEGTVHAQNIASADPRLIAFVIDSFIVLWSPNARA